MIICLALLHAHLSLLSIHAWTMAGRHRKIDDIIKASCFCEFWWEFPAHLLSSRQIVLQILCSSPVPSISCVGTATKVAIRGNKSNFCFDHKHNLQKGGLQTFEKTTTSSSHHFMLYFPPFIPRLFVKLIVFLISYFWALRGETLKCHPFQGRAFSFVARARRDGKMSGARNMLKDFQSRATIQIVGALRDEDFKACFPQVRNPILFRGLPKLKS